MAYPDRHFLPGRRLFLGGALSALAWPASAEAEISKSLIKGSMSRFKLTRPPKPVPDLEFLDVNNESITLSYFKGQARLINLWATWCAPCVKEMPSLDRLQANMPRDRFMVLPISVDGPTKPKVKPFYEAQRLLDLHVFFDKDKTAMSALGVSLLPTSILVDPEGRELGRLEGDADWDTMEGLSLMRAAMAA
jgi:thiol-disulfide isomerase/thioredoxin